MFFVYFVKYKLDTGLVLTVSISTGLSIQRFLTLEIVEDICYTFEWKKSYLDYTR